MDRVERIIEVIANTQVEIRQETKILLRGQVAFANALEKLIRVDKGAEAQLRKVEIHKSSDERLNALIAFVEDLKRRDPRPPKA